MPAPVNLPSPLRKEAATHTSTRKRVAESYQCKAGCRDDGDQRNMLAALRHRIASCRSAVSHADVAGRLDH